VFPVRYEHNVHIKNEAISVSGCGGIKGLEMLRLPHFLRSRLTNGGKDVSLTHRPSLYSSETLIISVSGT
jgi:hypothetical protein